jgi:ribulose bisphosphate carboxylase small subunit
MEQPTTPDVTPETRDNLLKTLEANAAEAIACLRTIQSSLAIDGPLLKPDEQYTKEQVTDMLRQAYNLGATTHEECMQVRTNSWTNGIDVHIEVSDGGFSFSGEAEVDADVIKEAVEFENHKLTDTQVDEILNA